MIEPIGSNLSPLLVELLMAAGAYVTCWLIIKKLQMPD
jgi:hypothetical protein